MIILALGPEKQPWSVIANFGWQDWLLSLSCGALTILQQIFRFWAMQNQTAAKLQKMQPLICLYSFVFDITIFHSTFTWI